MEEKKWYIEVLEKVGAKKLAAILAIIVVAGVAIRCMWNCETRVKVSPALFKGEQLKEEKELRVQRTGRCSDGVSVFSVVGNAISSISSEAEAISLYKQMVDVCKKELKKTKIIKVPENAASASFETIAIYAWSRSGKYLLGEREFTEINAILCLDTDYIYVTWSAEKMGLDINIETGRILK